MAAFLATALPALFGAQAAVASDLPSGGPPPLRVCTTGDYKPLTSRDPATGQYSGLDIDMATDLAVHLGREPVFVATRWAAQTNSSPVSTFRTPTSRSGRTTPRSSINSFPAMPT